MSDAAPDSLFAPQMAPRDRRIVATAVVSVALHLALIGWLVLPRLHLPEPAEPPAIAVELVPAPASSAEAPSSSAPPPVSSAEPSSAPSSEAVSSAAEPPSSEPSASSAEAASSAAGSSASEPPSSAVQPPVPAARPIVIPVGPSASASETASASEEPSSAASEPPSSAEASAADEASALTTTDPAAGDSVATPGDTDTPPPSLAGALHAAKRFYLDAVLDAPAMARAREAIRKLPPEKRLVQTCNIEAVGQLGNAGRGFSPDAVVANAFVPPVAAGSSFTVKGGAFRSGGKWYALAYACTLSKDMDAVTAFSYRIGADVTATLKPKLGG